MAQADLLHRMGCRLLKGIVEPGCPGSRPARGLGGLRQRAGVLVKRRTSTDQGGAVGDSAHRHDGCGWSLFLQHRGRTQPGGAALAVRPTLAPLKRHGGPSGHQAG